MTDPAAISPILILTNQLCIGGAEVYVVTVSRWLAQHGVRVAVAATPGDLVSRLHPDVDYHPVPLADIRWTLPVAVARVRAIVNQLQPKAIVANSLVTAWIGRLATLPQRIPIIEVAHGWPVERYPTVAKLMRVNDLVVPVSNEVERRLRDGGLPHNYMHVIANGVDLEPFSEVNAARRVQLRRDVFKASDDDIVVVNTGRYADQKAQHHIVDIAARLKESHPQLRFGVIGYGERETELQALIDLKGVSHSVTLTGKRSDVPALLLASDVYINCSNWEGMPLSTIEAMGARLPLVCTETEGIAALIPNAKHGLIVPVGDPAAMTKAIARMADESDLRLSIGTAARALAEAKFSKDRMCSDLSTLIAGAVA